MSEVYYILYPCWYVDVFFPDESKAVKSIFGLRVAEGES